MRRLRVFLFLLGAFLAGCPKPPAGECQSARDCEGKKSCVGHQCLDSACGDRPCRPNEGCVDGRCVSQSCLGVSCPEGQACAKGECYPTECNGTTCGGNTVCWGTCTEPSCVEVPCREGFVCAAGRCQPQSCAGVVCGSGAACEDGRCVSTLCVGVVCGMGAACADGRCVPVACPDGATCPPDQGCVDGECRDLQCVGVVCGPGSECSHGTCTRCPAKEAACSDGRDEDCDGKVDCIDPDCTGSRCGPGSVCESGACRPGCTIDGFFLEPDAVNPSEPCLSCQPAFAVDGWSAVANGTECGAEMVCTDGACKPACGACGQCGKGTCEPAVPSGWTGYYAMASGAYPAPSQPAACSSGSATARYFSGSANDEALQDLAACTACACPTPATISCLPPVLTCWASADCSGADFAWPADVVLGVCRDSPNTNLPLSCRMSAPVAPTSTCGAPTPAQLTSTGTFRQHHDACPFPTRAATCSSGQRCVDLTALGTGQRLCIQAPGAQPCPQGWPSRTVAFQGGSDSRACGACGCALPACSGGVMAMYDGAACTEGGSFHKEFPAGACSDLCAYNDAGDGSMRLLVASSPVSTVCTPQAGGGQPVGAFTKTGQVTLCCR